MGPQGSSLVYSKETTLEIPDDWKHVIVYLYHVITLHVYTCHIPSFYIHKNAHPYL